MANRRNNPDESTRIHAKPTHQLEKDKDQEQEESRQEQEPEHSRAQNQVGNQAIAAMINARAGQDGVSGDAEGGSGHSVRARKAHEKEGQDYGGDDIVDDVPINLEDLTRSWNPGTRKSEDRPKFVEPMPDDDLPPEDTDFLADVAGMPSSGPLPAIHNLDAMLQPSAEVVAASTSGWAKAAARWAAPTPGWRALGALVASGAPVLQSADARVLPARAAVGALGSCLLATSSAVQRSPRLETGALIELCLELEGRAHRTANLIAELESTATKLPRAAAIITEQLPGDGTVTLAQLPPAVESCLLQALQAVVRWPAVEPSLPALRDVPVSQPDPDDPLGLDAVMSEALGEVDREQGVYQTGLQTAERIATLCSMTRIQFAALCRVVDDVARLWSRSPAGTMQQIGGQLDTHIDELLRLLLDVARAVQKRRFPPPKIRNGLVRGARRLDQERHWSLVQLSRLCGGLLPGMPDLAERPELRPDPLSEALDMGAPLEALSWVDALPPSADASMARGALLSLGNAPLDIQRAAWSQLRDQELSSPATGSRATVATLMLAHIHARMGHHEEVLTLSASLRAVGRARRNGLIVAQGALLAMETHADRGDLAAAHEVRRQAGRLCWDLGARGALSLLARWTPPSDEDTEFSPFFDYGWGDQEPEA